MPRRTIDELTPAALNRAVQDVAAARRPPGLIRVGGVGGLALNVRMRAYPSGPALSTSWVLRRTFEGRRRDFALGAWPEVTLAAARERARVALDRLWAGEEPVAARKPHPAPQPAPGSSAPSFREAAHDYWGRQIRGRLNPRDTAKWSNDLESFAYPVIGDLPVDEITTAHMLEIADRPHVRYGSTGAKKLWSAVPDRAARMLKKIEAVLEAETRLGHRSGDNPAAWRGHLSRLLPAPAKTRPPGRQPALPFARLPAFMVALRGREPSMSSRALEFLILTAARSGEVRGAQWSEVDLETGVWTVPAARMKAGRDHRVPLPGAAVNLLRAAPRFAGTDLIFPGATFDKSMSDATLAMLVKKLHAGDLRAGGEGWTCPRSGNPAVPHGFRSTFRDWAAEETDYPGDMAEMALAHDVGSAVERAYRRTDMLERRRAMMNDWAGYALSGVKGLRAVA